MQSCKGKFCFEEGNYLMQTSLIVIVVIAAVIAIAIAAWYLRKSLLFSKGTYGKQTVNRSSSATRFPATIRCWKM